MNTASVSNKPRVLITGIEGFTGQYLARDMEAKGFDVFGTSYNYEHTTDRITNVDLCDREAIENIVQEVKPDMVAHLAALAYVADRNVSGIYQTNFMGSYNLLEALGRLESRPRTVLMASSATVYGNNAVDVVSEATAPDPNNDYAVSKYAMERMARLWMTRLPIVIVRPFNYTGVGQATQFLIPKIVQAFAEKRPVIELGNLDVWREFGDVRSVVDIYRRLLEASPAQTTVNVCTGIVHSLREVIAMCEKITGHKIEITVNPEFVRANEVKVLQGDNQLLKSLIGDMPEPCLEETLRWMLRECGPVKS